MRKPKQGGSPMVPMRMQQDQYMSLMGSTVSTADVEEQGLPRDQPESCCRRWRCVICTGVTFAVLLAVGLVAVFVGGKAYANAAIRDADIGLQMAITVTGANTVQAHISGEVTNHAVVGATMRPATMVVSFGGAAIGTVDFPQVTLPGGGSADLSITSNMTVLDTDAFTAFAVAALEQAAVDVTISGNIDVHAAGVTFDGVTFDKTVTLKGLSGFTDPPPVVLETDILEGLKDVMVLSVTCEMPNYSSMALLNAGQMTMDVMIGDVPLGVATSVGDVSFMFGAGNKQTFLVNVTRNNGNAGLIDEMVGNYTSGFNTSITLRGHHTTVPLLNAALKGVSFTTNVPGLVNLQDKLLTSAYSFLNVTEALQGNAKLCPGSPFPIAMPVYLFGNNKFSSDMIITAVDLKVYWMGADGESPVQLAYANVSGMDTKVLSHSITVFEQPLCALFTGFTEVLNYLTKVLHVDVSGKVPFVLKFIIDGSMTGTFGQFTDVHMDYTQTGVMGIMQLWQAGGRRLSAKEQRLVQSKPELAALLQGPTKESRTTSAAPSSFGAAQMLGQALATAERAAQSGGTQERVVHVHQPRDAHA